MKCLIFFQFEAVYLLPVYPELSINNINHQPSATMMLGKTVTMSMLCWGCLLLILVFGVHHSTAGPGHYIHDYYKNQLTEEVVSRVSIDLLPPITCLWMIITEQQECEECEKWRTVSDSMLHHHHVFKFLQVEIFSIKIISHQISGSGRQTSVGAGDETEAMNAQCSQIVILIFVNPSDSHSPNYASKMINW